MADAFDTMRYLVKRAEIAPAGTREEGEAASALATVFHKHGLETANKEFTFSPFAKTAVAMLAGITGVAGVLSGVAASGAFPIIMLIIGLIATVLFFLEHYGIRTVSRIPGKGSSQNVVARHPAAGMTNGQKARPVVVIAHYDTPRADLLSLPVLARFKPYLPYMVAGCMAVVVVAMLVEVLPFPQIVRNVGWAVAIMASIVPLLWAINALLHQFVMPFTIGANNNKSGVAAVFGLLDRVRPIQGGTGFGPDDMDEAFHDAGVRDASMAALDEEQDRMTVRRRSAGRSTEFSAVSQAARVERDESMPVRYGEEIVRSLGILPESCTLVYEQEKRDDSRVHRVSRASFELQSLEAKEGETALIPAADIAAEVEAAATVEPPAAEVVDKDAAADAIMAGIVGAPVAPAGEEPFGFEQGVPYGQPVASAGETSLMAPVGAASMPAAEPVQAQQPLHVITSTDDYDVELHNQAVQMPPDVAEQSAQLSTAFTIDDPDSFSAVVVNDPSWGTSSFKPVAAERRILSDIPDPAVAAVDPFSVASIEPVGGYNPEDFSNLDFETGTHQAVTPAMLEDMRRRNLDGFSAEITETKRGRKAKKGRQGRISHQAARMQAEMEESSFNDWLGLDENFDAKTSGRQIGSWDNFADDGGPVPGAQDLNGDPYGEGGNAPRWQGGAARSRRTPRRAGAADNGEREVRRAAMVLGDRDLIAHEIWFVLTGASEADHAGVRDFLQTYRNELRGAYFVNLECVGAGRECLVVEEGFGRRVKADHRLVNIFGQASSSINRPFALSRLDWCDTEATPLLRQGCRAVTVCGMEHGVPAHAAWKEDKPERVDPAMIDDVVDVLVEVIKNA